MELNHNKQDLDEIWSKISNWCAKSEKCAFDVREKLFRMDIVTLHIDDIVQRLEDEGFINEQRYVSAFVHDKVKFNKWGKLKIKFQLNGKQISSSAISKAIKSIDQKTYQKNLLHHLKFKWKQLSSEEDEYTKTQKTMQYAHSKGFELNECRSYLDKAIHMSGL